MWDMGNVKRLISFFLTIFQMNFEMWNEDFIYFLENHKILGAYFFAKNT